MVLRTLPAPEDRSEIPYQPERGSTLEPWFAPRVKTLDLMTAADSTRPSQVSRNRTPSHPCTTPMRKPVTRQGSSTPSAWTHVQPRSSASSSTHQASRSQSWTSRRRAAGRPVERPAFGRVPCDNSWVNHRPRFACSYRNQGGNDGALPSPSRRCRVPGALEDTDSLRAMRGGGSILGTDCHLIRDASRPCHWHPHARAGRDLQGGPRPSQIPAPGFVVDAAPGRRACHRSF